MDSKMLARLGAVVFVAVAITAAVVEMTRKDEAPAGAPARIADGRRADCSRRYRPLDYRRYRERQRHDPPRAYPREALPSGHHDQSRRYH